LSYLTSLIDDARRMVVHQAAEREMHLTSA
jgi:hypothetical protein